MPRLVRRAPLHERIKAYLDPMDWWMWASEELNTNDWDDFADSYAAPLGVAMNLAYMVARANAGQASREGDDVFGDSRRRGSGWLGWFMGLLTTGLTVLSFANAFYTFHRKRHYRLFEQPIETAPSTPSAQRVRVNSSPSTATPLRFLKSVWGSESAASRAHPDPTRDVWEVSLWNPNPLCLRLFYLFSPLHVVLYCLSLPVAHLEARPSVKVVTTTAIAALLSLQLYYLTSSFLQLAKDSAIIHRQNLNEYNIKLVHPLLQKPQRDVGIQTITTKKKYRDSSAGTDLASEVDTYTPVTMIKRGFHTHPNQAYASQYDPENLASQPAPRALGLNTQTPSTRRQPRPQYTPASAATTGVDFSSPIRQSNTPNPFRQAPSQFRSSHVGSGDGGSLGVYSHAASPLRKSASANYLRDERGRDSPGERRPAEQTRREGSPLKRMSTPTGFTGAQNRASGLADPFNKGEYTGLGVGRRESGRF